MLLFLLILAALALFAQSWSMRHALDGVSYCQRASRRVVEPDEEFVLRTTLRNGSRRFVPFLRMSDQAPRELIVPEGVRRRTEGDEALLGASLYLLPRQQWQRELPVRLARRGRYLFRGATLRGGDFLGLSELSAAFSQTEEVVVLPRRSGDVRALTALGGLFGDRSVNRFILEDPVLTLGVRDYTGREPQKSISWKQSARLGRLVVKEYDHTIDESVTVLLNVEIARGEAEREEKLERCFSLARSVCEQMEARRVNYRFLTNASAAGASSLWTRMGDGLGQGHLGAILEGLGRATYDSLCPFAQTLDEAARSAEQGRSHVLITPEAPVRYARGIARLEQLSGTRVLVLTPEGGEGA